MNTLAACFSFKCVQQLKQYENLKQQNSKLKRQGQTNLI